MDIKYPLAKQTITNREILNLINWLAEFPRLTMGEVTKEFERRWAELIGTRYAVYCNSGSSANLLMLYTLLASGELEIGDKVLVPTVGWGTTIAPIIQLGLEPIMCDVSPTNFGISIKEVEYWLENEEIAAIMYVNVLGVPASNNALRSLAERDQVWLLEDSCAALGSSENDVMCGANGHMSSFSFYFGHQLSTIEGGMVNTNSQRLYEYLLMARSHGWIKDLPEDRRANIFDGYNIDPFHEPFTFLIPGFNLRGTDLQARIGLGQLDRAPEIIAARERNHRRYMGNLETCDELFFQVVPRDSTPCSISFGAVCRNPDDRKKIVEALVENGIETRIFSAGNLARHPFWTAEYEIGTFPVADSIHDGGFFLPNYPELSVEDVDFVCSVVKGALA